MSEDSALTNLTNHFLIAMPSMADPYFAKSLVYIAEHNEQGALGLVVNRPLELNLATLLERISISFAPEDMAYLCGQPVFFGGPVQTDRGFVLHRPHGQWQSTLIVNAEIGLTSSRDILEAVARGEGPRHMLLALGYAGWGAGQLEDELARNAWLNVQADEHVLFETLPREKYDQAMRLLGFNAAMLSEQMGHA